MEGKHSAEVQFARRSAAPGARASTTNIATAIFIAIAIAMVAVTSIAVAPPPAHANAATSDSVRGRPGSVTKKKVVTASHWDLCAPGGLTLGKDPITGGDLHGCWKPRLTGSALKVRKSPKHRKRAQRVTVERLHHVSWSGDLGTWQTFSVSTQTRTISARKKSTRFARWDGVFNSDFGHYMVTYKITWRTKKGKFLGQRVSPVRNYRCATTFGCQRNNLVVWLDTPWYEPR